MKILIADDNKIYTQRVARFIERSMPYVKPPVCASNGQEALALARELCGYQDGADTIALIDVRMPHMDGLTLIAMLRKQYPSMRIILISAYDDKDYLFQAIRLGVHDYLVKPVDHEAILLQLKVFARSLYSAVDAMPHGDHSDPRALLCQQFEQYVADHFRENLSLELLAEKLYCSKSTLTNEVKKHLGLTVMQYILRHRMDQAVILLKRHDLNIQQVSSAVGYGDTNYFIRCFKQHHGVTPALWRRRHLGGEGNARIKR